MYLAGSALARKYFPDFRECKDIDFITNDFSEYSQYLKQSTAAQEYHCIPCSPSREMAPDELYTLKVSHAIYDIHWRKTMSDIRFFQKKGCSIDERFLENLREHWRVVHIHPRFKRFDFNSVLNRELFDDNVDRKFSHDDLHLMMSDSPAYKELIDDNFIPQQGIWLSLSHEKKISICFEEAFVVALERFSSETPLTAYNKAQQRLITSMHPLWLADWAIKNWNELYTASLSPLYSRYLENLNRVNA